jgi:acyl-CoA thioesterase
MSLEIMRDPKEEKYIFLKLQVHEIRNGRYDTDVFAYNEEGQLVALARHVNVIQEPKRKSEEYERELGRVLKL